MRGLPCGGRRIHKDSPSLPAAYGGRAARHPIPQVQKGISELEVVWDEAELDRWLANPQAFLGNPDQHDVQARKQEQDRADVIAYLRTIRLPSRRY
jgi:cytochrome c